ncbi:MAG: hypothetical protein U1A78_19270 [Polyangia bacterium]
MTALAPSLTWTSVIGRLCTAGADASCRIPATSIGHPLDGGLEQRAEASDGSYFDFERHICEETWLVARQYADAYDVWIVRRKSASTALVKKDESDLAPSRSSSSSLADLPSKAPGLTVGIATALGAIGGACAGGGKGAAWGAVIGTGAALAAVAVSNAASSPETSQVAQTMFLGLTSAVSGGSSTRRVAPPPAPARPARSASSRGDRFDRADFEVRGRRTTGKK